MEDLKIKREELKIDNLGPARVKCPFQLSTIYGDSIVNYVNNSESVLLYNDRDKIVKTLEEGKPLLAFERAGPREKIYFDPSKIKAGIVTCGGLCPGINNVIRSIVMELHYRYRVKSIFGFRYGYRGFIAKYGYKPMELTPGAVRDIHEKGGSLLSSSRGPQDVDEIVDCLDRMNISIIFIIGGDGTLRGAQEIYEEITKRKLKISVIGIPKTIDNDISFMKKAFGLETAFSVAADAIKSAHTEAKGAPYGIGLVKVMGRLSGFIAANAALAMNEVNIVLIPEVPFDLYGENGFLKTLEKRLTEKGHAVIIVADRKSTRLNSSHTDISRMPSSA